MRPRLIWGCRGVDGCELIAPCGYISPHEETRVSVFLALMGRRGSQEGNKQHDGRITTDLLQTEGLRFFCRVKLFSDQTVLASCQRADGK